MQLNPEGVFIIFSQMTNLRALYHLSNSLHYTPIARVMQSAFSIDDDCY